jgi:NAD(P)H-dependent FMN reductase
MSALKLVVIYGSVRTDRRGIRAARFITKGFVDRGHDVTFVDALEYNLPLLDRMYKEYAAGGAPAALERLAVLYRSADGFVIVTGEYNHGVPPGLINLLDHFLEEYFWRPSGIVCYSAGAFGGVRAAVQLRAILCELGMPSIPSELPIPRVSQSFDEQGTPTDSAWSRRFERFALEFEWYARALREARRDGVPY